RWDPRRVVVSIAGFVVLLVGVVLLPLPGPGMLVIGFGLAILATNMKTHLDQAFLRRLRFVVNFPMPDSVLRRRIWAMSFPPDAPAEGIDLDLLARLEVAGGNIRNIALNAAFLAAEHRRPLGMRDIAEAARAEFEKIDRQLPLAEFAGDRR
ncbi:MAG: PGPGW domain-containing protein, partial [Alphaproteobacteria bacterium]